VWSTGGFTVTFPSPTPIIPDIFLRYGKRTTCPKCETANSELKLEYCAGGLTETQHAQPYSYSIGHLKDCQQRCSGRDHIHLTCPRCNHTFLRLAADAPEHDDNDPAD
jgi:phage FluMu protein Com